MYISTGANHYTSVVVGGEKAYWDGRWSMVKDITQTCVQQLCLYQYGDGVDARGCVP